MQYILDIQEIQYIQDIQNIQDIQDMQDIEGIQQIPAINTRLSRDGPHMSVLWARRYLNISIRVMSISVLEILQY